MNYLERPDHFDALCHVSIETFFLQILSFWWSLRKLITIFDFLKCDLIWEVGTRTFEPSNSFSSPVLSRHQPKRAVCMYVCGGSDGTMTMTRGKKELINLLLLMMLVFFSSFYNSLHSHWKMSWWGCCIMCTRATHTYLECAVQPKQNWMKMTYQPIVGPFEYTI